MPTFHIMVQACKRVLEYVCTVNLRAYDDAHVHSLSVAYVRFCIFDSSVLLLISLQVHRSSLSGKCASEHSQYSYVVSDGFIASYRYRTLTIRILGLLQLYRCRSFACQVIKWLYFKHTVLSSGLATIVCCGQLERSQLDSICANVWQAVYLLSCTL